MHQNNIHSPCVQLFNVLINISQSNFKGSFKLTTCSSVPQMGWEDNTIPWQHLLARNQPGLLLHWGTFPNVAFTEKWGFCMKKRRAEASTACLQSIVLKHVSTMSSASIIWACAHRINHICNKKIKHAFRGSCCIQSPLCWICVQVAPSIYCTSCIGELGQIFAPNAVFLRWRRDSKIGMRLH